MINMITPALDWFYVEKSWKIQSKFNKNNQSYKTLGINQCNLQSNVPSLPAPYDNLNVSLSRLIKSFRTAHTQTNAHIQVLAWQ